MEFENLEKKIDNFNMLVNSGEHFIFFPEDYNRMPEPEKKKAAQFVQRLPLETSLKLQSNNV